MVAARRIGARVRQIADGHRDILGRQASQGQVVGHRRLDLRGRVEPGGSRSSADRCRVVEDFLDLDHAADLPDSQEAYDDDR